MPIRYTPLFIAGLILAAGPAANLQKAKLLPRDHPVELAGVLRLMHGYGPPGFGEDKKVDARITYWVLDLSYPVNTPCTPDRPRWKSRQCQATTRLRLFFPALPVSAHAAFEKEARGLEGREVTARGVVHRSETTAEITPLYMDVAQLRAHRDASGRHGRSEHPKAGLLP